MHVSEALRHAINNAVYEEISKMDIDGEMKALFGDEHESIKKENDMLREWVTKLETDFESMEMRLNKLEKRERPWFKFW